MSILTWLMLAVVVGLVQEVVATQAASKYRTPAWNFGPRDEPIELKGVAGRLDRAFWNFLETFPFFAVAVLVVVAEGRAAADLSMWGAAIYVIARAVYVPLYAFGVRYLRSAVWTIAVFGMILVIIEAF